LPMTCQLHIVSVKLHRCGLDYLPLLSRRRSKTAVSAAILIKHTLFSKPRSGFCKRFTVISCTSSVSRSLCSSKSFPAYLDVSVAAMKPYLKETTMQKALMLFVGAVVSVSRLSPHPLYFDIFLTYHKDLGLRRGNCHIQRLLPSTFLLPRSQNMGSDSFFSFILPLERNFHLQDCCSTRCLWPGCANSSRRAVLHQRRSVERNLWLPSGERANSQRSPRAHYRTRGRLWHYRSQ